MDERIGFGLYQSCGNRGVLHACLCCGGVGVEWVGGLDLGLEGWCYVCVSPDSVCIWQVQVSVYCDRRISAHLRCSQCSILLHMLPTMYLFMADIANPDLFMCGCRTCICLDITRFNEEQRQPWSACLKTVNRAHISGGGRVRHILHSSL